MVGGTVDDAFSAGIRGKTQHAQQGPHATCSPRLPEERVGLTPTRRLRLLRLGLLRLLLLRRFPQRLLGLGLRPLLLGLRMRRLLRLGLRLRLHLLVLGLRLPLSLGLRLRLLGLRVCLPLRWGLRLSLQLRLHLPSRMLLLLGPLASLLGLLESLLGRGP